MSNEQFDAEARLKELLPQSFDKEGNYVPSYAPSSNEPVSAVTVEAAPKEYDEYPSLLVGAGTGTLGAISGRNLERVTSRVAAPTSASSTPTNVSSNKPYTNTWGEKTGYGIGEGSTREQSEAYKRQFRNIGEGKNQIKSGRLWNVDEIMAEIARKEKVAAEEAARLAEQKSLLGRTGRAIESLGKGTEVATHIFPRLMTGLGAFGVGAEGTEAVNRYNRGDYPGAAIAGMGALGSAASMMPHPLTRGIGTAAGALSPLMLQGYDYLKDRE
jgi:hypothetical protein